MFKVLTFSSIDYAIAFDKCEFGGTISFLDVSVSNITDKNCTDIYSKPTDTHRYLHRSSFHPSHTFTGIPFSQMRRAVLICSTNYLRDLAISNMISYFSACGYKSDLLEEARLKAVALVRDDLLNIHGNQSAQSSGSNNKPLCFILPHSSDVSKIKKFVYSCLDDIKALTGASRIIFSQKRNPNTASLLFNKFGFSQNKVSLRNQKCGAVNCDSCALKLWNNNPIELFPGFKVYPCKYVNCKSSCVIYVAICIPCRDFYFGQTMTEEHVRMNGHRDKFDFGKFDKSAISMHIYTDHPDMVEAGLSNFNIVILDSTNAINLNRRESFYIWSTEADIRHLSRYKLVK